MTRKPHRTRPLDRDGDGHDGGSLTGNQTAPMATANGDPNRPDDGPPNAQQTPPEQLDDLADARTTPGDSAEKLEAIEREVDEANAATSKVEDGSDPHASCVHCGEEHPVGVLDHDLCPACVDEAPILNQLDAAMASADDAPDPADTFTAEEIAAGQTPVIQAEGDAAVTAAEVATEIPSNDPLVQIETETAPIAVRARELRLLVESRRLYKSAEGYSATYGAPYVDQATVEGWIQAGLAEDVPTAGICGGIKPTHEARRHLGQLTLGHYAPGTIGAAGEDAA
ncbi:hypothetical protein V8J38_02615 [Brevundimonas olei]|uniref:Uncharacterized protein n=1 Tax=Brevundimonas olei TaxID=657642 RepID=A0ABZ2IGC4_9CAUL